MHRVTFSTLLAVFLLTCVPAALSTPPYIPLGPVSPFPFQLSPSAPQSCTRTSPVDLNVGSTPALFITSLFCQLLGSPPNASALHHWEAALTPSDYFRRIDVFRSLCLSLSPPHCPPLAYSDPWQSTALPLTSPCLRPPSTPGRRDVGVVFMFFFHCPSNPNCALDWANTHQLGMATPSPWYALPGGKAGYLHPHNPGWWYRELQDAQWAGLQFAAVNVYGPDITTPDALTALNAAMAQLRSETEGVRGGGVAGEVNEIKVAAFFDSYAWGEASAGPLFNPAPDLNNATDAAARIYTVLWQPFFRQLNASYLYRVSGRPAVYMYNAGTLKPASKMAATLQLLKAQCQAEFNFTPFVSLDIAFAGGGWQDAYFHWDTFTDPGHVKLFTQGNVTTGHAMVKWDSMGRDVPGQVAREANDTDHLYRMHKGGEILAQVMGETGEGVEVLTLATWNDLGEGTGMARQYDLWYQGQWLPPHFFMNITRNAQCIGGSWQERQGGRKPEIVRVA